MKTLEKLKSELPSKLDEAIKGMKYEGFRIISCEEFVGYINLLDGRKAKISIVVNAGKSDW